MTITRRKLIVQIFSYSKDGVLGSTDQALLKYAENLEQISRYNSESLEKLLTKFENVANKKDLSTYYLYLVHLLSKDLAQQVSSSRITLQIKQNRLLYFIEIVNECFHRAVINHFLGASDSVLHPIYFPYLEKVKQLRTIN